MRKQYNRNIKEDSNQNLYPSKISKVDSTTKKNVDFLSFSFIGLIFVSHSPIMKIGRRSNVLP